MKLDELVNYLDNYLRINEIKDYGPQGLQVESENQAIERVALAVDVSIAGISAAAKWGADILLVHHGIFWRDVERLIGPLGARVRLFLKHGLNLYATHLPLDAHPTVGNNAVLAQLFGVEIDQWWAEVYGTPLGIIGNLKSLTNFDDFAHQVGSQLNSKVRALPHGKEMVQRVAILSGFGADRIAEAKALGADVYLTGETSHQNYWAATDYDVNLIYAGHYATETVGVKAMGDHLTQKFGLENKFFDFPTGM